MRILIAEDDTVTRMIVAHHVEGWGFEAVRARDGREAWQALAADPEIRVAILDWEMPGLTGVEVARRLVESDRRPSVYCILATARDTEEDLLAALEHGAHAFLSKPVSLAVLRAHVTVAERLMAAESRIADLAGRMEELAERRAQELVATRQLARTDELTRTLNRRGFAERAESEFSRARRYLRPLSAVCLDLDHFKGVNDLHGHHAGDHVLVEVAVALRDGLRDTDVLARVGGEELTVLLPETDLEAGADVAERLRRIVEHLQVLVDGEPIRVTVSVGVTTIAPADGSVEHLLRRADAALLEAKCTGRNRVVRRPAGEPVATFKDWQRAASLVRALSPTAAQVQS